MKSDFYSRFIGKPSLLILIIFLGLYLFTPEAKQKIRSITNSQKSRPTQSYPRSRKLINTWLLPLDTGDRTNWNSIIFESDAHFMAYRKGQGKRLRLHTAIDMQNGGDGGTRGGPGEIVYSMGPGIVLGTFDRLPNHRVVIEHLLENGRKFWTAYVHINESLVSPGEAVDAFSPIARRMNLRELDYYGIQFDHVHVEVMKKFPPMIDGKFKWMTFHCYTPEQVYEYFYNPKIFLLECLSENGTAFK